MSEYIVLHRTENIDNSVRLLIHTKNILRWTPHEQGSAIWFLSPENNEEKFAKIIERPGEIEDRITRAHCTCHICHAYKDTDPHLTQKLISDFFARQQVLESTNSSLECDNKKLKKDLKKLTKHLQRQPSKIIKKKKKK